ncbi:hypothetical protein ACEPAF_6192 [Sanghuangporus sanghuang]
MVFSLFGRGKTLADADAGAAPQQTQLRTPSPTASISAGTVPPQSPEVAPVELPRGVKRSRSLSPKPTGSGVPVVEVPSSDAPTPPTSPAELLARIKRVPPKTLHTYIVTHLPHAPLEINEALMAFFATLVPPPRLHCVRCHKDFVEVENTDRSCLIPHDDESAEVEYVGSAKNKSTLVGSTYQTLWGCCNKVVEGDGDQGPPDGWCFEGFHTTDVKRARFRADSTIHDDKLVSCARKRCFGPGSKIAGSERGRGQRAAARKNLREASDEEEDYDERELAREAQALTVGSDAGEDGNISVKKKSTKSRKRRSDAMDVESEIKDEAGVDPAQTSPPSNAKPKPRSKSESTKPKAVAKAKPSAVDSTPPNQPAPASADDDAEMSTSPEIESKPKPKKPRKPRKSAADGGKYVPPRDGEEPTDFDEEEDKPKRKKAKRKSIASAVAVPP